MNQQNELVKADLRQWVREALLRLGLEPADQGDLELRALNGDAGFRCYFRVDLAGAPLLAVYAPPDSENNSAFIKIAQFMRAANVRTPEVYASDLERGFLLIEDLGEELLLAHLNRHDVDSYYSHAMMILLRMQQSPLDHSIFPAYDRQKLRGEMALFPEWFVEKKLGLQLGKEEHELIDETFSLLEAGALEQPQVIVHRDYHSRNLIFSADGNYGVIDFQDAVIGPVTYDLVSLLKDCYIAWPEEKVESWMQAYANMAVEVGIVPAVSLDTFRRWFLLMGLQRHIKVLGIFCRLSLRDKKHGYLEDLPLVLRYVHNALKQLPELAFFHEWFESRLIPVIMRERWMRKDWLDTP